MIIEEAAGNHEIQDQAARLSEAKLESSKLNLSRINDILRRSGKSSSRRSSGKRRRRAATREIREQMRGLLRQVLASKAKELDLEAERLAGLLGEIALARVTGSAIRGPMGSRAGTPEHAHL